MDWRANPFACVAAFTLLAMIPELARKMGLSYYASLFYSMDVGEARAEQGGIHEAMMGAGSFVGPCVAGFSLMIAPQAPHAGVWVVSGLLAMGLAVLLRTRLRNSL